MSVADPREGTIGAMPPPQETGAQNAAPQRANNVFDCRRQFGGSILSACSTENAAPNVQTMFTSFCGAPNTAPTRANNVFDCRRRFGGGILSACSAENEACIKNFQLYGVLSKSIVGTLSIRNRERCRCQHKFASV